MLAKLLAVVVIISLTFSSGLQVEREQLLAVLKNVPLLVRALVANFVIVPILGVLLVKAFHLAPMVATGFLLMAIAPGVPFVLVRTRQKGGSLELAVALAVVLPLLSIVTVPLTAALVLPAASQAQLPLARFAMTLVLFQLLPLLIGIIIGTRLPQVAERLTRPILLIFWISVTVLLIALLPRVVREIASIYGSLGILASFCLVILSFATGWALGGPAREDRRVLAIGTTLRNIGLCALIATTNFPQSDVVAAVMTYLLVQAIVVAIASVLFTRTAHSAVA